MTNPTHNSGSIWPPADGQAPVSTRWLMRVEHRVQHARHTAEIDVLNRVGLSWRGYVVLTNAARHHGVDCDVLANASAITKATLTPVVDTLTRAGLIRRARNPSNRRRMTITVTEQGYRQLFALHRDIESVATAHLPELVDLLADIDTGLRSTITAKPERLATCSGVSCQHPADDRRPPVGNGGTL